MMVKMSDLFGFANDLGMITYGPGFKLIIKRNINYRALYRVGAGAHAVANDVKIDIRDISCCVPSIDLSNDNRIIVQKGFYKKIILILVIMKEKQFTRMYPMPLTSYLILVWKVVQKDPIIIIGLENNNVNRQTHDAIIFDIMNVTECYCKIGSEFYPEDRMNINYGTNNYDEAFKEIVNFNKDYNGLPHNIKQYTNHRKFKRTYRIYVYDTRYQNDHIGQQPIQLNFQFRAAVAVVVCHALVLTRKVICVNSDGNKMVDIIS